MFSTQAASGHQGQHRFFTTAMKWGEIDRMLVLPSELGNLDEDEEMQRGFARARLSEMTAYLQYPDHFFSALTLIMLPRDLDGPAAEYDLASDDEQDWDFAFTPAEGVGPRVQSLGTLDLAHTMRLFPADGQHRAVAAREALKEDRKIEGEEVPVVLVPYVNRERVRQLFADLNLNAKPVSKTIGYAYDHRRPTARLARRLASDLDLFRGRVNMRTNSLPKTSNNVITLNTLVIGSQGIAKFLAINASTDEDQEASLDAWLTTKSGGLREQAVDAVADVFEVIIDAFESKWTPVLEERERAAGKLRDTYVFPHGLGWQALTLAAATLISNYPADWSEKFEEGVGALDWERTAPVWNGNAVIHEDNDDPNNTKNRVNNTGPAVRDVASKILEAAGETDLALADVKP